MKKKNPSFFTSNTGTCGEDFFGLLHSEKTGLYILIIVYIYVHKFLGKLHTEKQSLWSLKQVFWPTALPKTTTQGLQIVFFSYCTLENTAQGL